MGMIAHACNSSTWRLRQEGYHEFEANLSYIISSSLAWATVWNFVWKDQQKTDQVEAEACRFLWVQSQLGLHRAFQASKYSIKQNSTVPSTISKWSQSTVSGWERDSNLGRRNLIKNMDHLRPERGEDTKGEVRVWPADTHVEVKGLGARTENSVVGQAPRWKCGVGFRCILKMLAFSQEQIKSPGQIGSQEGAEEPRAMKQ